MRHKRLKLSAVLLLGLGLTGLQAQTMYVKESSGSTFTDPRDGKVYQTVVIGNQVWMAENLAYLPSVNMVGDGSEDAAGSYYYVYGYDGTNVADAKATDNYATYGVLYNIIGCLRMLNIYCVNNTLCTILERQ